ncbi:hypothetical protein [Methylocella tundrae]|uniref:hypothetical protein n=1 Tax=Methylocella tundrae TaxID=227605 RepID=UPI00106A4AD1|nr:hypothetical protein [Methylocella tundrae]WPP04218.1 hypothetical protein SIN04_17465 [Methylocella tundrae]
MLQLQTAGYLVAAAKDEIFVYNLTTCARVGNVNSEKPIRSLIEVADSPLFITANGDRTYSLWDATSGTKLYDGVGVAPITNVIGGESDFFAIEGIRTNLNFLRLDPFVLRHAMRSEADQIRELEEWLAAETATEEAN